MRFIQAVVPIIFQRLLSLGIQQNTVTFRVKKVKKVKKVKEVKEVKKVKKVKQVKDISEDEGEIHFNAGNVNAGKLTH